MKEDIVSFMNNKAKPEKSQKPKTATVATGTVKMAPLTGVKPEDIVKKLTGMKKAMTKTMTESRSIPFFTFMEEIDTTQVMALR